MTIKIPCIKCGALILESTAEKHKGLCFPCASGTRESIEATKKWYAEHLELERTDPFRLLWRDLVDRVHKTPSGFASLTEAEKQYFAVCLLDGEVYNGGFDQYFFNSSGNYYKYALTGLDLMGADNALRIFEQAKQVLFGSKEIPEDRTTRTEFMFQREYEETSKKLDELDKEYCKDLDGLSIRGQDFARKHGLV